ncbi:MAG: hypothetical protein H7330_00535 [Hymenobacteraceae bacterium]|nr:hypothetical protein [Hymenobacteraceae bacterium]
MPAQKKPQSSENLQPGDPLFTLHHAEAEAELARQNPVAMTTRGLSANDSGLVSGSSADTDPTDGLNGPLDSQGQRRGQTPETGSGAGHH